MWARVMREARARVRENFLLRDAGIPDIGPNDGRRIEVVATGLPFHHGIPLAIDSTLVSPLSTDGKPHPGASTRPGASLRVAEKRKERTYPELARSSRLRLITAATEVGGRFNAAARELLEIAAIARARNEPIALRPAAARRWKARWLTLLAVAAQGALAATLSNDGALLADGADGPAPAPANAWLDACER